MGQRPSGLYESKVLIDNRINIPRDCQFCSKVKELKELKELAKKFSSGVCALIDNKLTIAYENGDCKELTDVDVDVKQKILLLLQNNAIIGDDIVKEPQCEKMGQILRELETTGVLIRNIKVTRPDLLPNDIMEVQILEEPEISYYNLTRPFSYEIVDIRGHCDPSHRLISDEFFYKDFVMHNIQRLIDRAGKDINKRSAGLLALHSKTMSAETGKDMGHAGACLVNSDTRVVWMLEPRNIQTEYDFRGLKGILEPILQQKYVGYKLCFLPVETKGVQNIECMAARPSLDVLGYCISWSVVFSNTYLYTSMEPLEIMDCLTNMSPCDLLNKIARPMNATLNYIVRVRNNPSEKPELEIITYHDLSAKPKIEITETTVKRKKVTRDKNYKDHARKNRQNKIKK